MLKALSLRQPWASLLASGAKRVETRGWSTRLRGEFAVHAAQGWSSRQRQLIHAEPFRTALADAGLDPADLPTGAIIAVATLADCIRFTGATIFPLTDGILTLTEQEIAFGDFTPGRHGFVIGSVRQLESPVPCRGALNFWTVPADVEAAIRAQLDTPA